MSPLRTALACLFVAVLGCVASPKATAAQQVLPRIGIITPQSPSFAQRIAKALTAQGLIDGKTVQIEWRSYNRWDTAMEAMIAELVRTGPDAIIVYGTPAARAVLRQTATIPVVFTVGDPVATGLLSNLSHPDANATGASVTSVEATAKLLDLVAELVPDRRRILVVRNPSNPLGAKMVEEIRSLASATRIQILVLDASSVDELSSGLARVDKRQCDAILIPTDLVFQVEKERVIGAVRKTGLPAVYQEHAFAEAGGLMSYGPDPEEVSRTLSKMVAKILGGARPAELPVEQVTKLKLLVNLRTAKDMAIVVPQAVLVRADEVIR